MCPTVERAIWWNPQWIHGLIFVADKRYSPDSCHMKSELSLWTHVCSVCYKKVLCLVAQPCPTLCDPMDCGPPGSSVHGDLRREYWWGFPCPPPGDLPNPGLLHCKWLLSHLSHQSSPNISYVHTSLLSGNDTDHMNTSTLYWVSYSTCKHLQLFLWSSVPRCFQNKLPTYCLVYESVGKDLYLHL